MRGWLYIYTCIARSARRDLETRWATIDLSRYISGLYSKTSWRESQLSLSLSLSTRASRFARDDEISRSEERTILARESISLLERERKNSKTQQIFLTEESFLCVIFTVISTFSLACILFAVAPPPRASSTSYSKVVQMILVFLLRLLVLIFCFLIRNFSSDMMLAR